MCGFIFCLHINPGDSANSVDGTKKLLMSYVRLVLGRGTLHDLNPLQICVVDCG